MVKTKNMVSNQTFELQPQSTRDLSNDSTPKKLPLRRPLQARRQKLLKAASAEDTMVHLQAKELEGQQGFVRAILQQEFLESKVAGKVFLLG